MPNKIYATTFDAVSKFEACCYKILGNLRAPAK